MKKKIIIMAVFLLLSVVPITGSNSLNLKTNISSNSINGVLYVGGSGPNNYTEIQSAVDAAEEGDTIFVYDDSSPYYENVVVNKSINLIGEDKNSTIVDGSKKGYVFKILGNEITITCFTIKNSDKFPSAGIYLLSDSRDNTIIDNIIISNGQAIRMCSTYGNTISQNTIIENDCGIGLKFSNNNVISHNYISNRGYGIGIGINSSGNNVSFNVLYKNYNGVAIDNGVNNKVYKNEITLCKETGIAIWSGVGNVIIGNNISQNPEGIKLGSFSLRLIGPCMLTSITKNNLMNNAQNAQIWFNILPLPNIWIRNYWDDWRLPIPRPIPGIVAFGYMGFIPWFMFDWHPSLTPYR
ncbi:MAG: NosD domain-containing protein [Candidatus Thermoplasmatota archaeon]|nr:NosD domain-containing protein [Candidatus Thermoplasmatota archaeon]